MKFLLVLAFAAVAVALPHKGQITTIKDLFKGKYNERIISGEPATQGQFPWQVAVHYDTSSGSYFCGGSIISENWVLTAGHCVQGAIKFRLQLGGVNLSGAEDGRIEADVSEYILHGGYNNVNLNNDIALLRLRDPVIFNDKIQPIRLPARGEQVAADLTATVSGWGKTSDQSNSVSNSLNFVRLRTITNNECTTIYGSSNIISSTLCCRGNPEHSTCGGDSGGPLVLYDWANVATHVGIVSFVHPDGCASGNPSAYVRTESFLDWIRDNTGLNV